jgi:hypothetical protein
LSFKDDFWDQSNDSSFFAEEREDLNSQISSKGPLQDGNIENTSVTHDQILEEQQ